MSTATAAAKPALTYEQHVAGKIERYDFALINGAANILTGRDKVRLTPKDGSEDGEVVIVFQRCENTPNALRVASYHGPPWKEPHAAYYATAACWTLFGEDRRPADAPARNVRQPLPPTGPPCLKCGRTTRYESAHVGGRGTCCRARCPGLDDGTCDHIEPWRS